MRSRLLLVLLLSAVLAAPGTAWAGPDGDPVCATDGTGCQPATHVVQPGDRLWKIARERLTAAGRSTTPRNVRKIADMIYADNTRVIGRDRHRLRVGQRLAIRVTEQWPL